MQAATLDHELLLYLLDITLLHLRRKAARPEYSSAMGHWKRLGENEE
jgi:hypothetical protein